MIGVGLYSTIVQIVDVENPATAYLVSGRKCLLKNSAVKGGQVVVLYP